MTEVSPAEEEVTQIQTTKIINPGSKIAIDKLDEENFLSWKFQVLVTLKGRLQNFIEGDDPIPSKNVTDQNASSSGGNTTYENWVRQDNLITA